jgi:hypothetical protein
MSLNISTKVSAAAKKTSFSFKRKLKVSKLEKLKKINSNSSV